MCPNGQQKTGAIMTEDQKNAKKKPARAEKSSDALEDLFLEESAPEKERPARKKKGRGVKKNAGKSAGHNEPADELEFPAEEPAKKTDRHAKKVDELDFDTPAPAQKAKHKKHGPHSRSARRAKARRRRRMRHTLYGTLSAIFAVLSIAIVAFCAVTTVQYFDFLEMRAYLDTDTFYPGVTVDGVELSGYTLADALDLFRERELDAAQDKGLTFALDGEEYTCSAVELGYGSNYAAVLQGAWDIGREGSLEERYAQAVAGCSYTISRGYDETMLRQATYKLAASLTKDSVNAEITGFIYNQGRFEFSEGSNGSFVDSEQLYQQAVEAIANGTNVQIVQQVIEPDVTLEELSAQYGEISSAVTNASSSSNNRINNIRLACSSINICLQPGEEFSFNGVVGQRTEDAGYKKAGVYVSGELGEEIGGGICQVSTTLFNAAVKADMEITERHNHSRPVSYVDNGKDATVSWGLQDFKFVNSSDEPIYIVAYVTSEWRVKVHIFGKLRTDGLTISVVPVLQETIQPGSDTYKYTTELPTGQTRVKSNARKGYRVNTYKAYTDADGNVVDKVFLCSSYYPAAAAVIEIGQ